MNRDSFWETFRDIFFLVAKVFFVFCFLQIALIAIGSEIELPLIHAWLKKLIYWYKDVSQGIRFGV